ncbi:MAG TPA: hypothetical protein PLO37_25455 [Candidatus Hydrogenedentes bacterium]|nr:hypothetical protein [Candidatus Hydrogenedentota bacterium]HPG70205.1 hypothetical protein [Candidatus Hydrogenedentota bacterium]
MLRIVRAVIARRLHRVTQWGNRHMQAFFVETDYEEYGALMAA